MKQLSLRQQQIIKDIEESNKRLLRAWTLLKEEQTKGYQFDYVSNPYLSDLSNALKSRATAIDDIIYQNADYLTK
jgi:hypothetical protein